MPKTGFVVSGILHVIILMLPVSMRVGEQIHSDREIELFISDSTPAPVTDVKRSRGTREKERSDGETRLEQKVKARTEISRDTEPLLPDTETDELNSKYIRPEDVHIKPEVPEKEEAIILNEPEFLAKADEICMETSTAVYSNIEKKPDSVGEKRENTLISEEFAPSIKADESAGKPAQGKTEILKEPPVDVSFGAFDGPDFIYRELPEYPRQALRLNREATVILMLTIDESGELVDIEIKEGAGYGFTEAAVSAVKHSTFRPAMRDKTPVSSRALLPIRFQLRR